MSRPVTHELDIYGSVLHVAYDRRAWQTLRQRMPGGVTMLDAEVGRTQVVEHVQPGEERSRWHYLIFIDVKAARDSADVVDTMAHEAFHTAMAILDGTMPAPGKDTDEPYAYLAGWITGWLWRNLPVEYHDRVRPPQRAAGK